MARNAGQPGGEWHCKRLDAAVVGGRGIIGYEVVSPDHKPSQRWIDPDLAFPVKLRESDGATLTLEHIRLEAQPENLFVLPAGYRKFNTQALIERIKHSDVWVDAPK